MSPKKPTEKELLKQVLEPLLDDFIYWFERSLKLLETERLPFYTEIEQAELIDRVKLTRQEVLTAKALFQATGGEAGIDSKMLIPWHNLVARCWDTARMWRQFSEETATTSESLD